MTTPEQAGLAGLLHNDASEFYSYRVVWSAADHAFCATVDELPTLIWVASEQGAALAGVRNRARETVAEMTACGEAVPHAIGVGVRHPAAPEEPATAERAPDAAVPLWVPTEIYAGLLRSAARQDLDVSWLVHSRLAGSREIARLEQGSPAKRASGRRRKSVRVRGRRFVSDR